MTSAAESEYEREDALHPVPSALYPNCLKPGLNHRHSRAQDARREGVHGREGALHPVPCRSHGQSSGQVDPVQVVHGDLTRDSGHAVAEDECGCAVVRRGASMERSMRERGMSMVCGVYGVCVVFCDGCGVRVRCHGQSPTGQFDPEQVVPGVRWPCCMP